MRLNIVLLLLLCCGFIPGQDEINFTFKNQQYFIQTDTLNDHHSRILLKDFQKALDITQGILGINHHPVPKLFKNFYLITFHSYYQDQPFLYVYNSLKNKSELLFYSSDFNFISTPLFATFGDEIRGIVFLGNNSKNDDLFYYCLESETLINLTNTKVSEKKFQIINQNPLQIRTITLYEETKIEFDTTLLRIIKKISQPYSKKNIPDYQIQDDDSGGVRKTQDDEFYITFIALGDSITAGQIEGVLYPMLAYPYKTEQKLRETYTDFYHIPLAIPGEDTYEATQRIHQALLDNKGKYFFYLEGTNDVWTHRFSADSSIENIEYTINAALEDNRGVVMSTIPPRKWPVTAMKNIRELNKRIRSLAREKELPFTEIFNTFVNYSDGWEDLMENTHKKNHPNAMGHDIIADLLKTGILKVKPEKPEIITLEPLLYYRYKATWTKCPDFDFSHFLIEYGFSPNSYTHVVTVSNPEYIFNLIPFDSLITDIYFRIKNVDVHGIESDPTPEIHIKI